MTAQRVLIVDDEPRTQRVLDISERVLWYTGKKYSLTCVFHILVQVAQIGERKKQ